MAKQLQRKTKKRVKSERPIIDEDLSALAEVLDEYRLDNNAEGWFKTSWRDGWNAVDLAYMCWKYVSHEAASSEIVVGEFINKAIQKRQPTADTYWTCGEYIQALEVHGSTRFLYAALRCLQILISNSSGGGEVYNVILKRAFGQFDTELWMENLILEYRCRDALGVSSVMDGGVFDRLRRAFSIAWRRGLYVAAYSIRPAETIAVTTTVWNYVKPPAKGSK